MELIPMSFISGRQIRFFIILVKSKQFLGHPTNLNIAWFNISNMHFLIIFKRNWELYVRHIELRNNQSFVLFQELFRSFFIWFKYNVSSFLFLDKYALIDGHTLLQGAAVITKIVCFMVVNWATATTKTRVSSAYV